LVKLQWFPDLTWLLPLEAGDPAHPQKLPLVVAALVRLRK
jgi:hypothetical protein